METRQLRLNDIVAGNNDRKAFDTQKLQELADSIRANGLVQPITVRWVESLGKFQIIAGERRYRAHVLLGVETVLANIVDMTDEAASAVMLIENVNRVDLNPIDEAVAYQSRMDLFGWTVADLAEKTGATKQYIGNRLKLLSLSESIIDLVKSGQFPIGYAQALADSGLTGAYQQQAIAHYRDNSAPTVQWFRRICGQLAEHQNQQCLFGPLFGDDMPIIVAQDTQKEPPHPTKHRPPAVGDNPRAILEGQAIFWDEAAKQWDAMGKAYRRQECEAAAAALRFAANYVSDKRTGRPPKSAAMQQQGMVFGIQQASMF